MPKRILHELSEQVKVVRWLKEQSYYGRVLKFTAIPNNTFTPFWSEINRKKSEGVEGGLPDLFILIPKWQIWIEMKRPRNILKNGKLGASPSRVEEEQLEWIQLINAYPNTRAIIAYGADEAINFLTSLIGDVSIPKYEKTSDEERSKSVAEFREFLHGSEGLPTPNKN